MLHYTIIEKIVGAVELTPTFHNDFGNASRNLSSAV